MAEEDFFPMPLPPTLTDGVILLGAHTLEDAEAHYAGEDLEMVRRFDGVEKAPLEDIRGAMRRWMAMRAAGGPQFAYAMRDLASGVLVGGCEMQRWQADTARMSYWTYADFRGRGYASRGLALLCAAAAKIDGVATLAAEIAADNLASRGVALRNGFVQAGTVTDTTWRGVVVTLDRFVRPAKLGG
ncbi:MAG TPA: GNAT family N-acetyltransferase [Caulobacteraceae bacterium]|jgi:RimJ/RimL family protein N-acetyltransferase|nr:GNAT family N-acetyltransferase [Caulobacteraceae bacterium]